MLQITKTALILMAMSIAHNALAQELIGAPRGTAAVPFTVLHQDSDFVGDINVGTRTFSGYTEAIVTMRVRGFSLEIAAGIGSDTLLANETSYYNPSWHGQTIIDLPEFVWWESDETTSYHIVKLPIANKKTPQLITIAYTTDDGKVAILRVEWGGI